ncbi:MAG: 50S ribosomal protein L23 [Candidatus Diapherotrites archaeon]|nr:50S ribosomal protein L23 [Candidatus Diapherotrites archaeon]MDZ4256632.1 50S ribosomal protein L23 [archaeon]
MVDRAAVLDAKQEEKMKAHAQEAKKAPPEAKAKVPTPAKGFAFELEDFGYLKYPLMTEKAITLIEKENKISFVAHQKATRTDVKKLIEKVYGVRVEKVNVVNDMKGRKKVTVKLDKKNKAEELAAKLGVI